MYDSQSSFFDDPAERSAEETQNGKIQNVAEVFELA